MLQGVVGELLPEAIEGGAVEVVVGEAEGAQAGVSGEGGGEELEAAGAEAVAGELEVLEGRVAGEELDEGRDGVGAEGAVAQPEAAQGPFVGDRGEQGLVGEAGEVEVRVREDRGVAGAEPAWSEVAGGAQGGEDLGVIGAIGGRHDRGRGCGARVLVERGCGARVLAERRRGGVLGACGAAPVRVAARHHAGRR